MERNHETNEPMTIVVQCATEDCENSVRVLADERYGQRCSDCLIEHGNTASNLNLPKRAASIKSD